MLEGRYPLLNFIRTSASKLLKTIPDTVSDNIKLGDCTYMEHKIHKVTLTLARKITTKPWWGGITSPCLL
jgi:hypothetical protein